jgi:hypothetical protein
VLLCQLLAHNVTPSASAVLLQVGEAPGCTSHHHHPLTNEATTAAACLLGWLVGHWLVITPSATGRLAGAWVVPLLHSTTAASPWLQPLFLQLSVCLHSCHRLLHDLWRPTTAAA